MPSSLRRLGPPWDGGTREKRPRGTEKRMANDIAGRSSFFRQQLERVSVATVSFRSPSYHLHPFQLRSGICFGKRGSKVSLRSWKVRHDRGKASGNEQGGRRKLGPYAVRDVEGRSTRPVIELRRVIGEQALTFRQSLSQICTFLRHLPPHRIWKSGPRYGNLESFPRGIAKRAH